MGTDKAHGTYSMESGTSTAATALTGLPEEKAPKDMYRLFWFEQLPDGMVGIRRYKDWHEKKTAIWLAQVRIGGIVYDDQGKVIYPELS